MRWQSMAQCVWVGGDRSGITARPGWLGMSYAEIMEDVRG
jgi:hypothetical protein